MRELLADAVVAMWRLATTPLRRMVRAEIEEVFAEHLTPLFTTGTPADCLILDPVSVDHLYPDHLYPMDDDGPRR